MQSHVIVTHKVPHHIPGVWVNKGELNKRGLSLILNDAHEHGKIDCHRWNLPYSEIAGKVTVTRDEIHDSTWEWKNKFPPMRDGTVVIVADHYEKPYLWEYSPLTEEAMDKVCESSRIPGEATTKNSYGESESQ